MAYACHKTTPLHPSLLLTGSTPSCMQTSLPEQWNRQEQVMSEWYTHCCQACLMQLLKHWLQPLLSHACCLCLPHDGWNGANIPAFAFVLSKTHTIFIFLCCMHWAWHVKACFTNSLFFFPDAFPISLLDWGDRFWVRSSNFPNCFLLFLVDGDILYTSFVPCLRAITSSFFAFPLSWWVGTVHAHAATLRHASLLLCGSAVQRHGYSQCVFNVFYSIHA